MTNPTPSGKEQPVIYHLACGQEIALERACDTGPLLGHVGDDAILVVLDATQPRDEIERELRRVAEMYGRMADDIKAGRFTAGPSTVASAPAFEP
jgi:hypothetical protein